MSNIRLIVAMNVEVPDIFQNKPGLYRIGGHTVSVSVSGIGQEKARYTTREALRTPGESYPSHVIVLGFCGGTRDRLSIGHLIVADRLAYEGKEIGLKNEYIDKAVSLLDGFEYSKGKLETFDKPVFSRRRVAEDTIAVDMEAYAIADESARQQVPVLIIKAVSDIVPQKADLSGLLNILTTIKHNMETAKNRLDEFARTYFLCD